MGQKRNNRRATRNCDPRRQDPAGAPAVGQGAAQRGPAGGGNSLSESRRRHHYLVPAICGLLLLAVGLVYSQAVRYEFINYDDNETVYEHPQVTQGLTARGIGWAFTHRHALNWVPLTCISHMLDWQLYGPAAGGHHLTNVVLHAVSTVLLFLVLQSMTGRGWPSALAAALFALHPLRVESVVWVTERKDVLSGLFFLLTLAAYVGYVRHRFSVARYLEVMVFFAMGLMAKPMLVTLPVVLLLLDYWPLGRFADSSCSRSTPPIAKRSTSPNFFASALSQFRFSWQIVIEKIPLLLLAAVSCVVTLTQGSALAVNEHLSLVWRLGNAVISYGIYLGQFFVPTGLAVVYPRSLFDVQLGRFFEALLVLLGITAVALVWRRKLPYLLIGWLWYLVMLVPVIGLVQIGVQAVADRFTYLPQIGLCIALAWGAADAACGSPHRRWAGGIASALVLMVLMGCAWRQTSFWRDSQTLWTHALACTAGNSVAHSGLGNALTSRGRFDEALDQFQRAVEISPDLAKAHYHLGIALARQGRADEAMVQYQKATAIDPDFVNAQCNFGNCLSRRGRFDEAMIHYQKALDVNPDLAEVNYSLGTALLCQGQLDKAVACYRKSLALSEQQKNRTLAESSRQRIAQCENTKSLPPISPSLHGPQAK